MTLKSPGRRTDNDAVTTAPVAGWYPDQAHPGVLRFFDGVHWTQYTAPMHAPGPAAPLGSSPSDPVHWLIPVGRTPQSVIGGYVALFALAIWPLGPVALALGISALHASARGRGHGRGRAWFAVIVGALSTAGLVLWLASYLSDPSS